MGYRHSREDILGGALAVAFDDGLSQLTFGRVAKRLGISDRVVGYYFPSKDELVGDVLVAVGVQLQQTLAPVLGAEAVDHLELVRAAWPVVAQPDADAVFALFFEANGLASAGRQPFSTLVPQLVEAWITWAAEFFQGTPARRRTEAEAAIALFDGLLLLRQLAGPDSASRAAGRLGVADLR
ncbi:MAG: TetR/AcrR family transcriptional regulator [Ilumatobacter sp.]|uniref:TetR/AcrR family transcriptional regulator n=1 Tax=Ilumatobacter sp. TaxID=1967498 RepID=UPI003299A0A3